MYILLNDVYLVLACLHHQLVCAHHHVLLLLPRIPWHQSLVEETRYNSADHSIHYRPISRCVLAVH